MMKNAVSGLGLAPDAAMVTFPIDMFLPGSDIASLELRKREFYNGLTKWKSEFEQGAGGEDAERRRRDLRRRAHEGEQPAAHEPVGRRAAGVAGDERARRLDPAGQRASAHPRARPASHGGEQTVTSNDSSPSPASGPTISCTRIAKPSDVGLHVSRLGTSGLCIHRSSARIVVNDTAASLTRDRQLVD